MIDLSNARALEREARAARAALSDGIADAVALLRNKRTEHKITGTALAARLGWPQSVLSERETGKRGTSIDALESWAVALAELIAAK